MTRSEKQAAAAFAAGVALLLAGCSITPEPIELTAAIDRATMDQADLYADQEPITGAVGLYEAVARGLKYNLDKRLKLMERVLADRALSYGATAMLPDLAASAGYRGRDSYRGSSSRSLLTGRQSLEVSTSEDKHLRTADLQLVWNVLDFGLSYIRARQDADRVLIAEERRIKAAQNIVLDVRDAYWRAVAAERMLPRVAGLMSRIEEGVAASKRLISSGAGEPADELKLQRALLEELRSLVEVKRRLGLAKAELAALINVPPGTDLTVVVPAGDRMPAPHLEVSVAELELAALSNRPELREEDLKKRISLHEVHAAYVRLLPGLELRIGENYDSNSFLFEPTWQNAAALVTKNLMELLTADRAIGFAEQDVAVADARRLTLSMAIIAQVHISLERYALAADVLRATGRLYGLDREIASVAAKGSASSATAESEALVAEARRTVSELQYFTAYGDVQNAWGRILNSVGAFRIPEELEDQDVASLAETLRPMLDDWRPPQEIFEVASAQ
jgi:outer membrane protein TolC